MAAYAQEPQNAQAQDADPNAAPQVARPPSLRWINGGPGTPNLIGQGQPVVVMLEVDGTPGSTVDVTGVVNLANNAWCANGTATIPPQGPGFATLVFTSLPSDISMPGGLNPFALTALDASAGQVSRQDTLLNLVNPLGSGGM